MVVEDLVQGRDLGLQQAHLETEGLCLEAQGQLLLLLHYHFLYLIDYTCYMGVLMLLPIREIS